MVSIRGMVAALALVGWAGVSGALGHEIVLLVGHNAAGQLKIDADLDHPVVMPVSPFPEVPGYFGSDPAFHSAIGDDVAGDLYELSLTSSLRWVLVGKDPGMEVFKDGGGGYMGVGETYFLGPPQFDVHPSWNLVNGVVGQEYGMTIKVVDTNGVYAESAPMEVSFTPAPEPGVIGLVGLGALVLGRRGRR
jgi:MYXO-CTERM domain-containing protein